MYPSSNDPVKINQLRELQLKELQLLNNPVKEEIIVLSQQPNSNINLSSDIQELIELIQALHYLEQKQLLNSKHDNN